MKILNLQFKNINSLEGENRIDFDQPPFSDTGVFAITGPNGSGKTSILDAITLALYGETFRFDKPAQHVITKTKSESFSQIEFALGNQKYRSTWQVKREGNKPRGQVMPSQMRLFRLGETEELMANSPQQVCSQIQELTGMDFRSFTRSILLAQGDFAAFLNALDNERMAILEKLISPDVYSDFKQEISNRLADEERKLVFLQQDLAAVPLIAKQSLEACELDLADFSEQVAEFQEEINKLNRHKAAFEQVTRLQERIAETEAKLQKTMGEQAEVEHKLAVLASAEAAQSFKEEIGTIRQQQAALEKQESELAGLQNELKQIQGTLAMPGNDILSPQQLAEIKATAKDLAEQKQALDGFRSQIGLYNANLQSEIILQKSLLDQIEAKNKELAVSQAWLDEHSTDALLLSDFPQIEHLQNLRMKLREIDEKSTALTKWSKELNTALQKN